MKKIFKGNIIFTKEKEYFEQYENGYIVVDEGKVKLVTKELPHKYKNMPVEDMGNQLIIPGFIEKQELLEAVSMQQGIKLLHNF
ncbi:MAG: guaD2 [Anaerocolumna sp.]|nr:guaD2 [Anaerocolumna sp.]